MKILHWAFVLIAIILPISLICRNTVNSRFAALKDEVRINNAIDVATHDAIDQIISVSGFDFSNEFGGVIDITPDLAQETVDTFFHTLAVNYNIPHKISDSTRQVGDASLSYIKNYFASYVPAVLVIAYDGFYIYSQTLVDDEYYTYQLSSKIPYTTEITNGTTTYTIGYTLGNDIYFYYNGECYSGKMKYNSLNEISEEYINKGYDDGTLTPNQIASITNDMSMILYSLEHQVGVDIGEELLPTTDTNFLLDYTKDTAGNYTVGKFHEKRRNTIIKIISECLNEEINVEHNKFASLVGSTYDFYIPEITNDEWINTIDDITVMAFVQGIPVGTTEGVYYNSYALGGSQIVKRDHVYMVEMYCDYKDTNVWVYHKPNCKIFSEGYDLNGDGVKETPAQISSQCWEYLTEELAMADEDNGIPCQWCY